MLKIKSASAFSPSIFYLLFLQAFYKKIFLKKISNYFFSGKYKYKILEVGLLVSMFVSIYFEKFRLSVKQNKNVTFLSSPNVKYIKRQTKIGETGHLINQALKELNKIKEKEKIRNGRIVYYSCILVEIKAMLINI